MSDFADLVKKISTANKEKELFCTLDEIFEHIEEYYGDFYKKAIAKVEAVAYDISVDRAEDIVSAMKPYGEKWSYDTIKKFVMSKGIDDKFVSWYLVMNMAYNDNRNTASMVGMADDEEFYYSLAKDFIEDVDGKPFKVERYFYPF